MFILVYVHVHQSPLTFTVSLLYRYMKLYLLVKWQQIIYHQFGDIFLWQLSISEQQIAAKSPCSFCIIQRQKCAVTVGFHFHGGISFSNAIHFLSMCRSFYSLYCLNALICRSLVATLLSWFCWISIYVSCGLLGHMLGCWSEHCCAAILQNFALTRRCSGSRDRAAYETTIARTISCIARIQQFVCDFSQLRWHVAVCSLQFAAATATAVQLSAHPWFLIGVNENKLQPVAQSNVRFVKLKWTDYFSEKSWLKVFFADLLWKK